MKRNQRLDWPKAIPSSSCRARFIVHSHIHPSGLVEVPGSYTCLIILLSWWSPSSWQRNQIPPHIDEVKNFDSSGPKSLVGSCRWEGIPSNGFQASIGLSQLRSSVQAQPMPSALIRKPPPLSPLPLLAPLPPLAVPSATCGTSGCNPNVFCVFGWIRVALSRNRKSRLSWKETDFFKYTAALRNCGN